MQEQKIQKSNVAPAILVPKITSKAGRATSSHNDRVVAQKSNLCANTRSFIRSASSTRKPSALRVQLGNLSNDLKPKQGPKLAFDEQVRVFVFALTEEEIESKRPVYGAIFINEEEDESDENESGDDSSGSFLSHPKRADLAGSASSYTKSKTSLVEGKIVTTKRRNLEIEHASSKSENSKRKHKLRRTDNYLARQPVCSQNIFGKSVLPGGSTHFTFSNAAPFRVAQV